jgi:hypothetical protein
MAACATQVCTLADEVAEGARHVIDDQSTDYTLFEVDEELQLLSKQGQQLQELLIAGEAAGYAGHAQFEEVQKAGLGEVHVEGAECWLEMVRGDLMAANSVQRTRAADTRPAGASSLLKISVERPPPS